MSRKMTPHETHCRDQFWADPAWHEDFEHGSVDNQGFEIMSQLSRNHFNETWYSVYPEWKLKYESEHRHD